VVDEASPGVTSAAAAAFAQSPLIVTARRLFVLRIVQLVLSVASSLVFMSASAAAGVSWSDRLDLIAKASTVLWLAVGAIGLGLLVPFSRALAATPAARLLRTALTLAAVGLLLAALQGIDDFAHTNIVPVGRSVAGQLTFLLDFGLYVAFDIYFWLAITRVASRIPHGFGPAYFGLLAIRVLLSLTLAFLPVELTSKLYENSELYLAFRSFRLLLNLAEDLLVIAVLWRLIQHGTTAPTAGAAGGPAPVADSTRDLVVGGLWLGGGGLVTVVSYAAAESGGHFVITTGAIAYGLFRLGRGLLRGGSSASPR